MNVKRGTEAREHDRTPLPDPLSDSALQIYATLSAPSILPLDLKARDVLRSFASAFHPVCHYCSLYLHPRFSMSLWQWADTLNIIERRITPRRFSTRALIKKYRSYLTIFHTIEISFIGTYRIDFSRMLENSRISN